jgi:hypothetical protein
MHSAGPSIGEVWQVCTWYRSCSAGAERLKKFRFIKAGTSSIIEKAAVLSLRGDRGWRIFGELTSGLDYESPAGFKTTRWSVVWSAGHGPEAAAATALEEVCRTYWFPL